MSIEVLRSRLGKEFERFLIEHNLCPECLNELTIKDGEKVCRQCGLVCDYVPNLEERIPYNQTRTPTNLLAYGKNLGGTIQTKGIWRLLADNKDNRHLPIRARMLSSLANQTEHPKITKMLRIGSQLCDTAFKIGNVTVYFGKRNDPKCVKFSNLLGRIIRIVGAYVILANTKLSIEKITKACYILALHMTRNPYTDLIRVHLGVDEQTQRAVTRIYMLLSNLA